MIFLIRPFFKYLDVFYLEYFYYFMKKKRVERIGSHLILQLVMKGCCKLFYTNQNKKLRNYYFLFKKGQTSISDEY